MYSYTAEALAHCIMALGSLGFADPLRGWGQAVDEVYGVYFYISGTTHSQWERPTQDIQEDEGETKEDWEPPPLPDWPTNEVPCEGAVLDLPRATRAKRWRRRVAAIAGESLQDRERLD